jgi:2-polyprenyl-3-methyl-5-hydroxy-6-metoxy-1,4-benzoquinol methylase
MEVNFRDVPIEAVRKFWDARPCNIRHSTKAVGERDYFDEVEARKYFVEPHIPGFARFADWKGKRVLEIGCGIGTDTINFARAGAHVTAVDLSERSLEIARGRAEVLGIHNIRFLHANVECLRTVLEPEPYDLVYSFGVIHHTPDPEAALLEIRNYLKPGGTLKLMVYHRYSWKVFAVLVRYGGCAFWDLDRVIARHSEAQTGCPVTYTYSRRTLRDMLERNGYDVEDLSVEHIFPWRISEYVEYRYQKVWYFRVLPKAVFRWLERRLGWHLCAIARTR